MRPPIGVTLWACVLMSLQIDQRTLAPPSHDTHPPYRHGPHGLPTGPRERTFQTGPGGCCPRIAGPFVADPEQRHGSLATGAGQAQYHQEGEFGDMFHEHYIHAPLA